MNKPLTLTLAAAVCAAFTLAPASAGVIVAEDFGGDGSTLNGATADTFDSGITSAGGSSTWVTPAGYLDDGTIAGDDTTGYLNLGSYINDTKGTVNGQFTLSATLDVVNGFNWVGFGFFESNTPATGSNFTASGSDGMGVIIYRTNDNLDGFPGPGTSNGASIATGSGSGGPELLTLVLDLTPAGGYDGSTNFGTITFYQGDAATGTNLGSHTYTSNESFGSIGLTAATSDGTIANLQLEQAVIPEPASLALISLGGLMIATRCRG